MTDGTDSRALVLTRIFDAPPGLLYKAWTEPRLLKQWFAPKPWTTPDCTLDLRVGGVCAVTMRSPEGQDFPNIGVYLDLVPGRRIVFTDAYTSAWVPSNKPFMTGEITFEEIGGGKTRYTARVHHWTAEDRETHETMGFHQGWGQCADQLAALLKQEM